MKMDINCLKVIQRNTKDREDKGSEIHDLCYTLENGENLTRF